jgi:hypothetical protein
MGTGRRPKSDLDAELAQLEREIAAATGEKPKPAPRGADRPRGGDSRRLDSARSTGRSVLRKAAAVAIIILAVAIALKVLVGFLATILWLVVGIAVIVALVWAVRQL